MTAPDPDKECRHHLRVRYCETDAGGVAHHGSFVAWLEEARTEWMRARGKSYREVEAEGFFLMVTEMNLRYRHPAKYDDELVVLLREKSRRRVAIEIEYEVRRAADERLLATAVTWLTCTDRSGQVQGLPAGV